jgi:hypothetical protein
MRSRRMTTRNWIVISIIIAIAVVIGALYQMQLIITKTADMAKPRDLRRSDRERNDFRGSRGT